MKINKNIILITSPNRNDGKSFVAANLAISYAEVGKKVDLVINLTTPREEIIERIIQDEKSHICYFEAVLEAIKN